MNRKHRVNTKYDFDKNFLKVMNNTGFVKMTRNLSE